MLLSQNITRSGVLLIEAIDYILKNNLTNGALVRKLSVTKISDLAFSHMLCRILIDIACDKGYALSFERNRAILFLL